MTMKKAFLFFVLFILSLSVVACGPDPEDLAISIGLTQTATVPMEAVEEVSAETTGFITGSAHLMAPPTPPLVIYAVNTITGEWVFVETPETDGSASFTIEVSPGTYQVFASGLGYSLDGLELTPVIVNAEQTVSGVEVRPPSPSECGPMLSIPAAPDGKFAAVQGATAECLASLSAPAVEAPVEPPPVESQTISIQFASGDDSAQVFGTLPAGGVNHYVLGAAAGQEMTVSLDAFDGNDTTLAISGADGTILNQYDSSSPLWTGILPSTQDYYIDILSSENIDIDYALVVSIITIENEPDPNITGGLAGSTNYPEASSPQMHIIATERATGLWYWIGTAENAGSYAIVDLPPSSYIITAFTQNGLSGGYVDGNGSFLPVMVGGAELVEGINLSWWPHNGVEYDPIGW